MSVVIPHGYRVVAQLLSSAEVHALRTAIEDCINRVARVMLTPFDDSCPDAAIEVRIERIARRDRAYASALLQVVMADAQRDERIAAIARHPALTSVIDAALAPDVASGHVLRTRAAIPSFTAQVSPWHQDVIRPQENTGCASVRLAVWIPLSDVDAGRGALEVIPGGWEAPLPHTHVNEHFQIADAALPSGERAIVPMRAGDVLLLDRYVPHRALALHGAEGRWSIVMWVKGGGAPAPC
ncbi:MAG: phytanoyl-CoA dioxygenase family protein [Vicinamibacterales bacterium]